MFKLLRTFVAVYETLSFSQAASQLFSSQPSLSLHIKQLEEHLNTQLFIRNGKAKLEPTPNATRLYQSTTKILKEWQAIQTDISDNPKKYELLFACSQTSAHTFVPHLLSQLSPSIYNTYDLTVEVHNSKEILDNVLNHRFAFGIVEKPIHHNLIITEKIKTDQLVLAGNLQSDTWLLREEGSGVYHYTKKYLNQHNIVPQNSIVIKNNQLIVDLLKQGVGKSIVSLDAIDDSIKFQTLNDSFLRHFYLIYQKFETHPSITNFINDIKKAI
ncbi:LysR family transcriptional regulator [Holzapfeliella sp. He02]|uniref:LysR family transcriptional regulator n=1 Tax=Holzapfeliella saturejae TaxID=3082953 RepID=A0ABU8SIT2_9LACO